MRKASGKVAPFPRKRFMAFCRELRVQTKDYGLQPFRLLGTQKYVLDEIEKGLAKGLTIFYILKARQLGMSTLFIALDLFWAFENKGLSGAFATHNDQSRDQFRAIIDNFFAHLPATHKVRKKIHNRMLLILANGSQFSYLVAGTKEKTTPGLGRSGAYNFLHATEIAFWGMEEDVQELEAAMSTHFAHRLQIYESTANGFNFYQRKWEEAKTSEVVGTIFVGWWRNELYAFEADHQFFQVYMPEGANTRLSPLERRRMAAVKEQYGADISPEQLAWYRWQLDAKQDADQSKMDELFPWTEDDAFVATGAKFFTNESLTVALRAARKVPYQPFKYVLGDAWSDTGVVDAARMREHNVDLRLWERPDPAGVYAIGCDPAYGSSDTADRTVICVDRCYADRTVQVAEFVSSQVLTYHCAWVLMHLAGYYRNVMLNLEISGPGTAVFQEMQALRRLAAMAKVPDRERGKELRDTLGAIQYYLYSRPDSMRSELAYQWRTTHDNKHAIMCALRDAVQLGRTTINSMRLLEEMRTMVYDEGSIYAEGNGKDDRVMAKALAHEAYRRWIQPKLLAQGHTYLAALKARAGVKDNPAQVMAQRHMDYLRKLGTKVG